MELLGLLIALERRHRVSISHTTQTSSPVVSNIRFEACDHVGRVLVLLFGDLGLVVEALVAEGLELFAGVLFAFGSGVVVAESTEKGS
jgi:hypothetical protein